ncbi:MAG: hypothetical protein ACPGN3_13960 [Opitutales bacterium]
MAKRPVYAPLSVFSPSATCGHRQTSAGFALVISITLMSFLLLIILSVVSVVRTEKSQAESVTAESEAYQNAVLGMRIALGELQSNLGADQRVSARADILADSDPSRKNMVGVWSSAEVPELSLEQGDHMLWLVSDGRDVAGDSISGLNTQPQVGGGVVLVGAGSLPDADMDGVADDLNDEVRVDMTHTTIDRDGDTIGRYAWWVGDEGMKARINMDRVQEASQPDKQLAVLESGGSIIANPSILAGLAGVDFESNANRLPNLDTVRLLIPDSDTGTDLYFHGLTSHSRGVLSDVRKGGLKKDLSLAFEMDDAGFNRSVYAAGGASTMDAPGYGIVQPIFWVGNSTGWDAHGPTWHMLRDYYRLYHEMEKPMTDPTLDARVFGPNLNHGELELDLSNNFSQLNATGIPIDQQPAVMMAGGKAKFFNHSGNQAGGNTGSTHVMLRSSGIIGDPNRDNYPNGSPVSDGAVVDFRMFDSDPILMDVAGDPLRGGGRTEEGSTMPVMVTGNYMPYMLRFISETALWFRARDTSKTYTPMGADPNHVYSMNVVNRERFIMHNPYNVSIRHSEIAVDSSAFDIGFGLKDLSGNDSHFYHYDSSEVDGLSRLNNGNVQRNKSTYFHNSFRQIRIQGDDTFGPGEIKTFAASGYTPGASLAFATEGLDPSWHHYKFNNFSRSPFLFEYPATPADSYVLKTTGSHLHGGNVFAGFHGNYNYSMTMNLFATSLRQDGNADSNGEFTKDHWPMASVVDTALLFPGQDYSGGLSYTPSNEAGFYGFPQDLSANEFVLSPSVIDAANSAQTPQPIVTVDMLLTPAESADSMRYPAFVRSNPLAPVRDSKNLLPPDDFLENSTGFAKISPDLSVRVGDDASVPGLAANMNFWGPTDGSFGGVANPVMIELPTAPVLSLGKLQHANLSVHAHMPALAIGNSLASLYIDPEETYSVFENHYLNERIFYDLSYHLNDALWDSYFFSGYSIPYDADSDDYNEQGDSVAGMFDDAFANGPFKSLPNSRMEMRPNAFESVADVRAKLFLGDVIDDAAHARSAENLMVTGAFNVNSTSVEAWRAVLSGARGFDVFESDQTSATSPTAGHTPFSRFSQPLGGEWDGNYRSDQAWSGFRSLSDNDIERLATEIVSEIQRRVAVRNEPYLSLADFVNRELSASASGRSGVIQSAIDRAGLNDALKTNLTEITQSAMENASTGVFPHGSNILEADDDPVSSTMSSPAYLMQADVLQAIGSHISVRSDTFRIRSYGESVNPDTGAVEGKVWLESVVQRIPEPVSPENGVGPGDLEYWDGLDENRATERMGRRFEIVSIRQLAEGEV